MKVYLTAVFVLLTQMYAAGQTCTAPGQNPSTAFPVCGTSTFSQSSVPICGGKQVPAPTCNSYPLTDVNPFWYKFTCFQSGTLGFKIKPHTNTEDYDWQLFDITNQDPNAVYSNVNLVVACNWSGESGETGASSAGSSVFVCEGYGRPLWSKMPDLVKGHEYILLVSHFTQTQAGYDLSFGGGTAIITDSTPPRLNYAEASCGGDFVRVKLNKKMKCSSIASNGSDFFISPGNVAVTSAKAINCSTGFDTDSIELQLASALGPGTYQLNIKNGSDGNTVLDYCDNSIPDTNKTSFIVFPIVPTPMDSLAPLSCKPQQLRLIFRKPMLCSTVASDGSDFTITGPYPVNITGAAGLCTGNTQLSKEIVLDLAQPLFQGGTFTLNLQPGTDGNTVRDECGQQTPAGSSISFSVKDTVNASFIFEVDYGCTTDTIRFSHPGGNGVDSWSWDLDENKTSNQQNPVAMYQQFTTKNISLAVSNGFCSDSSSQTIVLDNYLKSDFSTYQDLCPNEPTQFTNLSEGKIISYQWNFGDGGSSVEESPSYTYTNPFTTTSYTVQCTVTDSFGCSKTAERPVKVYSSCYLAVPTAFTPNNDGRNDFLYPLNAIKAEQLDFKVYNRWGQMIFHTKNWKKGWDGTLKGVPQPTGIYVWYLSYVDRDTKEARQLKGTAALIR